MKLTEHNESRKQTGVGYPQLSAVLECADAAHGLNGHIVADGGCSCPGDFAKVSFYCIIYFVLYCIVNRLLN